MTKLFISDLKATIIICILLAVRKQYMSTLVDMFNVH